MKWRIENILRIASHNFILFQPRFQPFHLAIADEWIGEKIPKSPYLSMFLRMFSISYKADNDDNRSNEPGAIHLMRLSCKDKVFKASISKKVSFRIYVNLFVRNINVRIFFNPLNVCAVIALRLLSLRNLNTRLVKRRLVRPPR